jgi:hypothetical protein
METTMVRIDRELAVAQKTDMGRWSNPESLEAAWDGRAEIAAQFIPAGARVLDLGCGKMALRRFLPHGCIYRGCDIVAREADTVVCDFNRGEFPREAAGEADIITMLGVLEYIPDADAFFAKLRATQRPLVMSYSATELTSSIDRPSLGWLTHFSFLDLAQLFDRHGFQITASTPVGPTQILMRLTPVDRLPAIAPSKVAVISYNDIGNFGDRLGYHLVHSVLPGDATVHHLTFKTLEKAHDSYDLVVLGIGNSLYWPILNEQLLDVLDRGKAKIGIFGTQYREVLPRAVFDKVLDRLDHWSARYEDDVMMFGRGRSNVRHLGDWLIDQFPMATPVNTDLLTIGDEVLHELPLDRTIQQIQKFKQVFSTRLHPLLCALTSAETVAYSEQPAENQPLLVSGKFRSMLIDIFDRTYPEKAFFAVDRNAVTRYKVRVHDNVEALRQEVAKMLRSVAQPA